MSIPDHHPMAEKQRSHGRGCKCHHDRLCEGGHPADTLPDRDALVASGIVAGPEVYPTERGSGLALSGAELLGEAIHEKAQQLGGDRVKGQLSEAIAACRSISSRSPRRDGIDELAATVAKAKAALVEDQQIQAGPDKWALDQQVGGGHYKDLTIQPVEYCQRNGVVAEPEVYQSGRELGMRRAALMAAGVRARLETSTEPDRPITLEEALRRLTPMDPAKLAEEQRIQGNLGKRALDQQVGGGHYKGLAIQPVEYCQRNNLGFCESSVVKYVTRWKEKSGVEDLRKARHFIDLLIEITESEAKKATYCNHAQIGYDDV